MANANDPAAIPYVINENGFWYVAYKEKTPLPYVTVSAKGIANGLSTEINDGYDFGPDSYDSSVTGSYGKPPYSQTSGIQEAWNYAVSVGQYNAIMGGYYISAIKLLQGFITVKTNIILSGYGKRIMNPHIFGDSSMAPYVSAQFNSGYLFTLDASSFGFSNIEFSRFQPYVPSGFTPEGIINADFSTTNTRSNFFISYEFNISNTGWTGAPLNLVAFFNITFYDLNDYSNSISIYSVSQNLQFFGGVIYAINAQNSSIAANAVSLSIIGARYTLIYLGTGFDLYLVGGRATAFTGVASSVILNGNVNTVYINSRLWEVATPFITGSYSIATLKIRGTYGNQYMSAPTVLVDSATTVENADVDILNVSAYSVSIPHNTPTIPSVPASGTAQANTNPYPVNVYIYGGTVTEIQYTPSGGTAVEVGTAGPATVRLNPGDSITLTYTAAPSWQWTAI